VLHGDATAVTAELVNVSLGGALLLVDDPARVPPDLELAIDVRLAGSDRWYTVPSRTLRRDAGGGVAVVFTDVAPELEDAIAECAIEVVESASCPRILLIDGDDERRRRLARILRMSGCAPVEARTPLEAVSICESASLPLAGAAIVEGDVVDTSSDVLARFLARTYPRIEVTRVAASGGAATDALRLLARSVRMTS
jgi:CheY-like chemotaxis protein